MQIGVQPGRIFMGRFKKGDDLLKAIEKVCLDQGIKLGEVSALGAVAKARVGFYDQDRREYFYVDLKQEMEILSLTGNVSLRDGKPFLHAHVTFGNGKGEAFGGHLAEGTEVFACEFCVKEYLSDSMLERALDQETGLFLWK